MPGTNLEEDDPESVKPSLEDIEVSLKERTVVARLRNSICALAKAFIPIFDTSVMHAYEVSEKYDVGELLRPDVMTEIAEVTRLQLAQEMAE
jgi:exosome complex component RRP4